MKKTLFRCLAAVLFGAMLFSCQTNKKKYHFDEGEIFHTYYHIKYESEKSLQDTILEELEKFDRSLNPFRKTSVIARVNRNEPVEVDSFFIAVFHRAEEISEKTGGMFDITCAPLVNLWGFGFENINNVDSTTVDSLLQFVGYRKVRLTDSNTVEKDDQWLKLDMSAIAKGYSVDVVCRLLERMNVENYMCEIGGEIRTKGVNPSGEVWNIGINKPIEDNSGTISEIQCVLTLQDKAVATSGDYRNFYYGKDGKRYAHTINPKTGYPAEQNILSATVVADNCMEADAYATAFMSMGLDSAKQLLQSIDNIEALFFFYNENGEMAEYQTEGLKKLLKE